MGDPGVPRHFAGQGMSCAFLPSCFSPAARQTRTPWGHYSTPCDFGLIWGVGSGFSTEKHKFIRKVARWLPRPGQIGAFEAVVWVRGRCLGGAASFLDNGGRTSKVAIQEQKYYALFGPPGGTENGKKWGKARDGSLEHD